MPADLLVDTNTAIALLHLAPSAIARIATANRIFVPVVVIGGLYYGAYHSAKVEENVARVSAVARLNPILDCDSATAAYYGPPRITDRRVLRTAAYYGPPRITARSSPTSSCGAARPCERPVDRIAALAIQHGLTLLTRDAHFDRVADLAVAQR